MGRVFAFVALLVVGASVVGASVVGVCVEGVRAEGVVGGEAGDEAGVPDARRGHAVLRFRGDLSTGDALGRFVEAIEALDGSAVTLIVVELDGDRARADLLATAIDAVRGVEAEVAVYLSDRGDLRVGPGQVALALAADRAAIDPACRVEREVGDGLKGLNPAIEDWTVLGLDLRARAKAIAGARGLGEFEVESLVAPRTAVWFRRAGDGSAGLVDEAMGAEEAVVTRSEEGWAFRLDGRRAAAVFGLGQDRSARAFFRRVGARGRAGEEVEVVSDLAGAHERCLVQVRQVRSGIELAEVALDVYASRRGREAILPRHYHAAADRAAGLVERCRASIAEVASLTDRLPEILEMEPPVDARSPTEIGGPARSRLSLWRSAVQNAERELSYLDERIADYRRR